jgi:hypothetical protein
MTRFLYLCSVVTSLLVQNKNSQVTAYSFRQPQPRNSSPLSRRDALAAAFGVIVVAPLPAFAAADCFKDCMQSCKAIAPKDPDYCLANCKGYCEQDDRNDGLSVSLVPVYYFYY